MENIFRFSNWNQLSGLKSKLYPNLVIHVTQFNSKQLIGTKIDIIDSDNHITYFTGFIRVVLTERFDALAVYDVGDMIKRINSYGYNIEIVEPLTLPPNVITMLQGLYALGYNYITLEYIRTVNTQEKALYQYNIDSEEEQLLENCYVPSFSKVYSNKYVTVTKNLNDVRSAYKIHLNQPSNKNVYVISEAPNFNWEDYKWLQPARVYSIELLLNPDNDTTTPISDADVNKPDEEPINEPVEPNGD